MGRHRWRHLRIRDLADRYLRGHPSWDPLVQWYAVLYLIFFLLYSRALAWYEWYPADAVNFDGITISAGHKIQLTIIANTNKNGIVKIENHNTNQVVEKILSSKAPLCQKNAEWIVEDFMDNGVDVPFCDFGTVAFEGASATTTGGKKVSPLGAQVFIIEKNGEDMTSVKVSSDSVTISYQ